MKLPFPIDYTGDIPSFIDEYMISFVICMLDEPWSFIHLFTSVNKSSRLEHNQVFLELLIIRRSLAR